MDNGSHLQNVFSFMEKMRDCEDAALVHKIVLRETEKHGVQHVFAGVIPQDPNRISEDNVLFGSWPAEWLERYFDLKYFNRDPAIQHVLANQFALNWREVNGSDVSILEEAGEFGLKEGYTVPMISLSGVRLGMSFAGSRLSSHPSVSGWLQVVASLATARVLEINTERYRRAQIPKITRQEHECLNWIAEGKTNWEIGVILGISIKTVEKHSSNAMNKLNALNRTQLVVKAMRSGLIS